jgi:hypothetical protein
LKQRDPFVCYNAVMDRRAPDSAADIPADWLAEFEAAARRPLKQRLRYAFVRTYKPVLDDARFRSFNTMKEYREWCEKNLPSWLGYGRV